MHCNTQGRFTYVVTMLAVAFAGTQATAAAQGYPNKTVRIIVPFSPGGGTDIQGRLLSKKFYESTSQTFVVDNRSGASGLIGTEMVVKAPPDGYTVLFTTASLSVNVSLFRKTLNYDPVTALAPVSWVSSVPLVLIVHPSVPAKTLHEFIDLAKHRAGDLNGGNNGAGTTSHLSLEMLKQMAGVKFTNVAYKGGGPAMNALLSGEVDFEFSTALTAAPQIKSGRVKALAVTTTKRSGAFPELPTMASVYPGFESDNWYAMFVPVGTPAEVIAKLNAEVNKALQAKDVLDYMSKEGADPVGGSPEELARYFKREVAKYASVIQTAGIKSQ